MNSDQGVQFTSQAYINVLTEHDIKISMDHKGRCFDNIFVERLWRTVKYEEIYLHEYESVRELHDSLQIYFQKYNERRLHAALGYKTPASKYFGS
jgi:putative transposase